MNARLGALRQALWRLTSPDASDRRAWTTVFACCLPVYLLTAHYTWVSGDTQSAVLPAWQLVHHGNVWVEHLTPRPYWSVPAGHHLVSNRMPGLILVNVPMVAVLYWSGPGVLPAALTAALLTATTAGVLFLVFRRLVKPPQALLATFVMAFGTSLWTISSAEVWPHTVDALCLSLVMYALARRRVVWAGLSFAAAITVRPHIAVIALVVGLGLSWTSRSLRPALTIGGPSLAGLGFVLGWNHVIYGSASVTGGYGTYASTNLTEATGSGLRFLLTNVAGFLFSPQRGLFLFLPLAALLMLGFRVGWRVADPWIRWIALGGLAYIVVQLKINEFTGGDAFYGYRLATELVVCAAPLALLASQHWVPERVWRRRGQSCLAVASVGLQAIGATAFSVRRSSWGNAPWVTSPLQDALRGHSVMAMVLMMATALVCAWCLRKPMASAGMSAAIIGAPS